MSTLEDRLVASLAPALRRALSEAGEASVASRLLPGVRVRLYRGQPPVWHASVLLDPRVYAEGVLPKRGNRPRVSRDDGHWWYDLSASETRWDEPRDSPRRIRTLEEARADLEVEVAGLLTEIAVINVFGMMKKYVSTL